MTLYTRAISEKSRNWAVAMQFAHTRDMCVQQSKVTPLIAMNEVVEEQGHKKLSDRRAVHYRTVLAKLK